MKMISYLSGGFLLLLLVQSVNADSFKSTSCTESMLCAAVGYEDTSNEGYLIATSLDGSTWVKKNVTHFPKLAVLNTVSCTGSGSTAICAAAGQTGLMADLNKSPILAVSTDGGDTWERKSVTGLSLIEGYFRAVSCTGTGPSAICTAVGQDNTAHLPLLAVSIDGANTWIRKSIPDLGFGLFYDVSCTGSSSSAICAAVGGNIAVSVDGGSTWALKPVVDLPAHFDFESVSCTGSSSSAICAAVGQGNIVVSKDGGNTWRVKTVTGLPKETYFWTVSCTGSEPTAVCTAGGGHNLAVSADGGNTWKAAKLDFPSGYQIHSFTSVHCKGNGAAALCIATSSPCYDEDEDANFACIAVSMDGGNFWKLQDLGHRGPETATYFNAISCTGSGLPGICTVAGQEETEDGYNPGVLMVSTDQGHYWKNINTLGYQ